MLILASVLVRAPLLGPGETLAGHPLGALAVAVGAPAAAGESLLARYQRRAGFRPTPHALWAGVTVGTLGARTRIELGEPAPWLTCLLYTSPSPRD